MTETVSAPRKISGERTPAWLRAAFVLAAAIFVYGPALRGTWVWDDPGEIIERPEFLHWSGLWQIWVNPASPDYLPLKSTVQWLGCRLWGENPTGFHILTLGLHVANALLFWRILRKLGCRGAWWGALLFIVHPLVVESVAWISELKNTLSLTPLLLSFLAYLDFDESSRRAPYWSSLGLFVAALLCKGSVVMFPCVLLGYTVWKRKCLSFSDTKKLAPFFLASLAGGLVTIWFQHHRAIAGAAMAGDPLASRFFRAVWALGFYFEKTLFPRGLMPVYPRPETFSDALGAYLALGLLAVSIGIAVVFAHSRAWARSLLFGMWVFVVNLIPVLGLLDMYYLRISPVADHFAYLSLLGVLGLAAAGWGLLLGHVSHVWRTGLVAVGAIACAGLAIEARTEAAAFHDDRALWSEAVAKNPSSWLTHHNLGQAEFQAGAAKVAMAQWQQALALNPQNASTYSNLGMAWNQLGENAKAQAAFESALRISPELPDAHSNLGLLFLEEGNSPAGIEHLAAAAKSFPTAPRYLNLGSAYGRAGKFNEAITAFKEAERLDPYSTEAHLNHAQALLALNRTQEASAEYQAAIAIDPECAQAYLGLGNILATLGKTSQAATLFKQALRFQPGLEAARKNLQLVEPQSGKTP